MRTNLFDPNTPSSFFEPLDWNSIITSLSSISFFDSTKEKLEHFAPLDFDGMERSLFRLEKIMEKYDFFNNHYLQNVSPINRTTEFLNRFQTFEKGHIGDIDLINYTCLHFELFQSCFKIYSDLNYIATNTYPPEVLNAFHRVLQKDFRSIINSDCSINYQNNPELRSLYNEQQKIEGKIRGLLQELPRSKKYENVLQYPEYDLIYDHFVLAVKSDSYNSSLGQIITRSSSGHTLLVEPSSIRELGNKRLFINAKIEEFLNRIFQQVSNFIFEKFQYMSSFLDLNLQLDMDLAKTGYCRKHSFSRPKMVSGFSVKLENFFNPLLDDPVPNDINLTKDDRGIVISGPNTGGKSVALKAVTLSYMFLHMGMFVPSSNAIMSPLKGLYFFSSDNQNIKEGLSSFSSEVRQYLEMLDNIQGDTLIVIDEIFNSTSSEEASLLAAGLIDYLARFDDIKLLISTHHKKLKGFLYENKKLISAHMGFDRTDLSPNYRLYVGEPGSSFAMSIFKRVGGENSTAAEILKLAEGYSKDETRNIEEMLEEISNKNMALEAHERQLEGSLRELENKRRAFNENMSLQKQQILKGYESKLKKKLDKAEELLLSIKKGEVRGKKTLFSKISDIASSINEEEESRPLSNKEFKGPAMAPEEIKVGESYYSSAVDKVIKVSKINYSKKNVLADAGKVKMWIPMDSIFESKEKAKKATVEMYVDRVSKASILLDGRGLRLEEFQRLVRGSLVDLEAGEIPFLDIIHGHGDGILKKWLRDYLKKCQQFEWSAEEGNDGVTKVKLS